MNINSTQIAKIGDTIITNDNKNRKHFWPVGAVGKVSTVKKREDGVFEYTCLSAAGYVQILIGSEIGSVITDMIGHGAE